MSERKNWDALLERDWGDAWDSLPDAPEWEPRAKTAQITLRMPGSVVARLKQVAARRALPYHALARSWIANGLNESASPSTVMLSDEPLTEQLNIKLDHELLDDLKSRAHEQRYPYHRLAREWIETSLVQEEGNLGLDQAAAKRPSLMELMVFLLHSSNARGEDVVRGITRLQKLLFVVEQKLSSSGDFYAFNYGPFDEEVNKAAEALRLAGFVEGGHTVGTEPLSFAAMMAVVAEKAGPGGPVDHEPRKDFALTDVGHERAERLRKSSLAYERLATYVTAIRREYDKDDLIERVYTEYPDFTENSLIWEQGRSSGITAREAMIERPFQHIVRIRSTDDLQYVNPDVMDEVTINANQLENDIESAAVTLWRTTLPFTVDPVLWRFQVPEWWRNAKGATKRNYARLGAWYAKGTRVPIGSVPLADAVGDERDWRALAGNVVDYQCSRLLSVPTHLTLFEDSVPVRDLQPARIIAPALVSFTAAEDRINTVLFDAAATALGKPLAAQVILPPTRLLGPESSEDLLATIPRDGVTSYMLWTPQITEELLLGEPTIFTRVLGLVESLSSRGMPVIHQHGNYAIAALRDAGLLAMTHHLGWVDHGEPAQQTSFARRSCRTYVPGVRHSMKFERAAEAGRKLGRDDYADRYCGCPFCLGVFDELGEHPLDLLLEERQVVDKRNRTFRTPTGRAVTANTFHYLWSRHLEIRAFASDSSAEVVSRDLERAGRLLDGEDISGLRHLADLLKLA